MGGAECTGMRGAVLCVGAHALTCTPVLKEGGRAELRQKVKVAFCRSFTGCEVLYCLSYQCGSICMPIALGALDVVVR